MRINQEYKSPGKLILLCLILCLANALSSAQEIDLENEMVARYLFEGNARNEVEDANHGIESNVQYETDRYDQAFKCIYLSGDDSYVTIPHTEDLNWDARTESYSIVFWTRSIDPRQGERTAARVISKWDELLSTPYPFSFSSGDTEMNAAIREANVSPLLNTINDIWNDQWHHVAMVFSHESHTMFLYYDGTFLTSSAQQFNSTTRNTLDICIGKTLRLNVFFKGFVDDLYFYDRAIEYCEIEALYSGTLLKER